MTPAPRERHEENVTYGPSSPVIRNLQGGLNVLFRFPVKWHWLLLVVACLSLVAGLLLWPEELDGTVLPFIALHTLAITGVIAGAVLEIVPFRPGRPRAPGRVTAATTVAAVLVCALGWVSFAFVRATGDVDMTGQTHLLGSQPVTDGNQLTATLDTAKVRDQLVIAFDVADHNATTGFCVPHAWFEVWLDTKESAPHATTEDGRSAAIALPGHGTRITLIIKAHTDRNCFVDVSIGRAVLHDT